MPLLILNVFLNNIWINTIIRNNVLMFLKLTLKISKGNRTIANLRYGVKDIISPSTMIFAPIKD